MPSSFTRRLLATLFGLAWVPTLAHADQGRSSLRTWVIGDWQSDRERTLENFHFQGQSLDAQQREKISNLFGHLRYRITSRQFEVMEREGKLRAEYVVASETDSTITLRFPQSRNMPDLTLYRVNGDLLFIKSGKNLEYFRRTAA